MELFIDKLGTNAMENSNKFKSLSKIENRVKSQILFI